MASISFTLDGKRVAVNATPDTPLLYALRDDLKMNAPHFGCGEGQCGACTERALYPVRPGQPS